MIHYFKILQDNANKELACSKQVVDVHKLKLHEFTQQNKDLKEKIERSMASHNEVSHKVNLFNV